MNKKPNKAPEPMPGFVVLAHASRQSPSWLIFDVRQKMRFFIPVLLILFWSVPRAAEPKEAPGYVHLSKPVTVAVEVFAAPATFPKTGRSIRFQLKVESGARFDRVADLIPSRDYARSSEEVKKTKMFLPDIRTIFGAMVVRGEERKVVAYSDVRLTWPYGFQLQDGDLIVMRSTP